MSHRDVTGAMADHWKSEHDKVRRQRDQLREVLAEAERLQRENYGDGSGLHVAMIYWSDTARAALKATEEGCAPHPSSAFWQASIEIHERDYGKEEG